MSLTDSYRPIAFTAEEEARRREQFRTQQLHAEWLHLLRDRSVPRLGLAQSRARDVAAARLEVAERLAADDPTLTARLDDVRTRLDPARAGGTVPMPVLHELEAVEQALEDRHLQADLRSETTDAVRLALQSIGMRVEQVDAAGLRATRDDGVDVVAVAPPTEGDKTVLQVRVAAHEDAVSRDDPAADEPCGRSAAISTDLHERVAGRAGLDVGPDIRRVGRRGDARPDRLDVRQDTVEDRAARRAGQRGHRRRPTS